MKAANLSLAAGITILMLPGILRTAEPELVTLSAEGEAKMVIAIPEGSEPIRKTAIQLQDMLRRISGADFEITTEAKSGPAIRLQIAKQEPDLMARENYQIFTSKQDGLLIEGATPAAVPHAVWDLLYRLGYRQYFPGDAWEIVPNLPTITVEMDIKESPDYASRRIWPGFGYWDHNREAWAKWNERNRMGGGFALNTGHAYGRLIRSQQKTFDAHPEYYALVDGKRHIVPHAKLCIGNPGVLDAAVAYAEEFFAKNPEADSVSVDPSDGGNWCECDACQKIGPASDRALLLANTVAEAINQSSGRDRFVGMYAYSYHSPPPSFKVHPKVVISAATGFIKGGKTVDDIITGWSEKGATIGIREYYSVHTWDRDLPGAARGSNLDYLSETIPKFHAAGARFLSAESSDNWGCNGLGYYFASRVMWDLDEAKRRDEIVDEFLEKCFGPAKQAMAIFYQLIEGSNKSARLVFDDVLARMYSQLNEARDLTAGHEAERRRIDDLILYTRYCELFDQYRNAKGAARQKSYEDLLRHAYRMRGTFMVHTLGLWRDLMRRDKSVSHPKQALWNIPEDQNPWKNSTPFNQSDISAFLTIGLANHQKVELDFEPKEYSDENLAPAKAIFPNLPETPPLKAQHGRGPRSWFTVVDKAPVTIELAITGGLIKHYRDRGNVKVQLWKLGGASQTGERKTLMDEDAGVPPDGKTRTVKLIAKEPGTYRIDLDDGRDMTSVTWPENQLMSWKMSLDDHPAYMTGRWHLYFYVPKGTRRIGLYSAAGGGNLVDPAGAVAMELKTEGGAFISAEVPEGMDGKLWSLRNVAGKVCLLNVPPFLARSADELVLPK